MIVTHTVNAAGQRRVYLGAKASLECWIEPKEGGTWSFHLDEAIAGPAQPPDIKKEWAIHVLSRLADELAVSPADLAAVPFETIAALHASSPYANRRMPVSKRAPIENSFMAVAPGITRPRAEFNSHDYTGRPRQR